MKKPLNHYEFYCVPDGIKPKVCLAISEAIRLHDAHLQECVSPRQCQVVLVYGKTGYREVIPI